VSKTLVPKSSPILEKTIDRLSCGARGKVTHTVRVCPTARGGRA
jgi:hypothetical protein